MSSDPSKKSNQAVRKMGTFHSQITFLKTDNLEDTAWFYEHLIGLELALDQTVCRIYRTADHAYIGFCRSDERPEPKDVIITWVTDDVDGTYEALVTKGAVFDQIPTFNPQYNIYHCFLRDPNGYLIEIQRFEDPAWKG